MPTVTPSVWAHVLLFSVVCFSFHSYAWSPEDVDQPQHRSHFSRLFQSFCLKDSGKRQNFESKNSTPVNPRTLSKIFIVATTGSENTWLHFKETLWSNTTRSWESYTGPHISVPCLHGDPVEPADPKIHPEHQHPSFSRTILRSCCGWSVYWKVLITKLLLPT